MNTHNPLPASPFKKGKSKRFLLLLPFRRGGGWGVGCALLLLSGCGHHNRAAQAPPDNRLRDSLYATPQTFDPALCQSVPNSQMLQQAFEGLVQYDASNKIVPCVADKWSVTNSGKTYAFHIRQGAKFQDGKPVTASDIDFSLTRGLRPALASPTASTYLVDIAGAQDVLAGKSETLSGIKVVDAADVAITLSRPASYFLGALTTPSGYIIEASPAHATAPLTAEDDAQGIGTGPYKINRYDKDQQVVMDANPAYWGGKPTLAGVTFRVLTDSNTRHAEFQSGQLDIVRNLEFGAYVADKDGPLKSSVQTFPRTGMYYLALSGTVYPPFKDVRVRQALAYATDKATLAARATAGLYAPAQDILPPGMPGSDPNFQGLPFDPDKAKTLLAQAGYPGGKGLPPLDLYADANVQWSVKTVDLLREMYVKIGVPARVKQMEFGALIAASDKKTVLPAWFIGWYADYLDPQDYYSLLLRTGATENRTNYSNPQFDALCDAADVEQDPQKRMALYRQAAKIAANDVPRIPIFFASDPELINPSIRGLGDCLMGHLPHKSVTFTH